MIDGSDAIVTEAVLETPLAVAVTVTLVPEETEPAVAEKAAPVAPAATVIEAGIVIVPYCCRRARLPDRLLARLR